MFMANQLHILANQCALCRERIFRDRRHPLDLWNDDQMYTKYALHPTRLHKDHRPASRPTAT